MLFSVEYDRRMIICCKLKKGKGGTEEPCFKLPCRSSRGMTKKPHCFGKTRMSAITNATHKADLINLNGATMEHLDNCLVHVRRIPTCEYIKSNSHLSTAQDGLKSYGYIICKGSTS